MGLIKVFLQTYLFHFCPAYFINRKNTPWQLFNKRIKANKKEFLENE